MKKLLSVLGLALVSTVAFAQLSATRPHHIWLCHEQGAPSIQCETLPEGQLNNQKCCWKNNPNPTKGDNGTGSKSNTNLNKVSKAITTANKGTKKIASDVSKNTVTAKTQAKAVKTQVKAVKNVKPTVTVSTTKAK